MTQQADPATVWDARFEASAYIYGEAPNDFLAEQAPRLPKGPALCLAEGEGRNAVRLAEQGFAVTGVDQSAVGLDKARLLAERRGVAIATEVADLGRWELGEARWTGIVSMFAHTPAAVRRRVHGEIARALQPGGWFLLEAYTPRQLETSGSGGPSAEQIDLFMSAEGLRAELSGLDFALLREVERAVDEGTHHHGMAAVVQCLAWKR